MKGVRIKLKTVVGVTIVISVLMFVSVFAVDNELLTQAKKYFKPLPKVAFPPLILPVFKLDF